MYEICFYWQNGIGGGIYIILRNWHKGLTSADTSHLGHPGKSLDYIASQNKQLRDDADHWFFN